jgi:hypothetical protein
MISLAGMPGTDQFGGDGLGARARQLLVQCLVAQLVGMADHADRGDLARLGGNGRFSDLVLVVAAHLGTAEIEQYHTACGWFAPPPCAQLPTVCAKAGVALNNALVASKAASLVI